MACWSTSGTGSIAWTLGDLDAFELDDLIHHYKQATKRLWVFCEAGGGNWTSTAAALADVRARGAERDRWAEAAGRGRRS